jgi:hypothetical protein
VKKGRDGWRDRNYDRMKNKRNTREGMEEDKGTEEVCTFLGYYAASSRNPLPMFPDNVSVPS